MPAPDWDIIGWRGEFSRIEGEDTGAVTINRGLILPTLGTCADCRGDVARAVDTDVDAVEIGRWKHLVRAVEDHHPVTGVLLDPGRWPVGLLPGPIRAEGSR